ncbi:MAG: hypothetical protein U0Y10_04580 [Spirosomataceae bacterium]
MNAILISDMKLLSSYNGTEVDFMDTTTMTVPLVLDAIERLSPELIFIYSELLLAGARRTEYKGLELLKHLRLTPLSNNLNNVPIVFFHWLPIEQYIENDIENLILFSPGIKRVTLPFRSLAFDCPMALTESLIPFLFNEDKDEKISEHQFRNEVAINQFETQSVLGEVNLKDEPIWYKKLYYKQGYFSKSIDGNKTLINQQLKILLVDDMGDKWKPALLKMMPNATIDVCKTVVEAQQKISKLQNSIITRRNIFNKKVNELTSFNNEIEGKQQERSSILVELAAINNRLNTNRMDLSDKENKVMDKTQQFKSFLAELLQNNGLLEILIDSKTDNLNTKSRQEALKLSTFITEISNWKENIISFQNSIKENEKRREEYVKRKNEIENEWTDLKKGQSLISTSAANLLESLFTNEYDLILLDMHLTKESESKQPNEMDGFLVLQAIQEAGLKIPSAIFSASTKKVEVLQDKFRFLQKHQFIKGITPIQKFCEIIKKLETESATNRLLAIIDEIMVYPIFKCREYEAYDSPNYQTIKINSRNEIESKLKIAKEMLRAYSSTNNKDYLKNIVQGLGDILRDARYKVESGAYKRDRSLFYNPNLANNRIDSRSVELSSLRNIITHGPKDTKETIVYEEWCRKLDLNEVEKHLITIYSGLIFDM